jgi:5-methylcytosine-specific restriction endonuclease McrA
MPARRMLIDGVWKIDPRHTRAWRRLRARVIRQEPVCKLRFPGICTGASTTADHIVSVTAHPELALVRSNVRGACVACNEARGSMPDELIRYGQRELPPAALDVFR